MKFISLEVINGFETKTFRFNNKTAIYSSKNSVGKSTLLRLLFYSIGYAIPSTKKIKFDRLITILNIENSDSITIFRNKDEIRLTVNGEDEILKLPRDLDYILGKVFRTKNINILHSILGAIYLDQDKGWTLLNRGTVIGGIKFRVETLIEGLSEKNLTDLKVERQKISLELKRLSELQKIIAYQKENYALLDETQFNVNKQSELENQLVILKSQKKELLKKVSTLEQVLNKNKDYFTYIESLKLSVKSPDGTVFPLDKNNVVGFDENQKLIELRIYHLEQEISKLEKQEKRLEIEIMNSSVLMKVENPIEIFEHRLQLLIAPEEVISSEIDRLNGLKNKNKEMLKYALQNEINQRLYESIVRFSKKLDVFEYLNTKSNFVFTNDLKSLSGTILHKLVFCFKMAYIVEIQNYLGIKLPIILDSPSGREVDQRNIEDMFSILNENFQENQIIIASIFNYSLFRPDSIIEIKDKLLE